MISQATIIGRSHRLMQQNCHDVAIANTITSNCAFGLVLDGCGSKHHGAAGVHPSHNEVGAKLLGQFTAVYLTTHLPHHDPDETFFANLYDACTNYLQNILALLPTADSIAQTRFIATHLLCTLVGFVIKGETAVFFWSGDGYYGYNNQITQLDSHNQPDYLAYQLSHKVNKQERAKNLDNTQYAIRNTFLTHTVQNPTQLIVASDGWTADLLTQLNTPQTSLALQRWLNLQAKERGQFEDDGAIAIWWRDPQ